jgi:aspartate/methionine/tyrosine aminotransferase
VPQGAFYAFVDVGAAMSGDLWALAEEWLGFGVAVLPGTAFGSEYTTRVRMSLATRYQDIEAAARRIRERVSAVAEARR